MINFKVIPFHSSIKWPGLYLQVTIPTGENFQISDPITRKCNYQTLRIGIIALLVPQVKKPVQKFLKTVSPQIYIN